MNSLFTRQAIFRPLWEGMTESPSFYVLGSEENGGK